MSVKQGAVPAAPAASAPVRAALDALDAEADALIARTMAWSAINSGSREIDGLARMRAALLDAASSLPGTIEAVALAGTERVNARGDLETVTHAEAIRVRVRPEAAVQIALTGHYDTVFPASHPF